MKWFCPQVSLLTIFSLLLILRNFVLGNILFHILWILQDAFFLKKYSAWWKGSTIYIWNVTSFATFYLGLWSQQEHCEDQLWRIKVSCLSNICPVISMGKAMELRCLISKSNTWRKRWSVNLHRERRQQMPSWEKKKYSWKGFALQQTGLDRTF